MLTASKGAVDGVVTYSCKAAGRALSLGLRRNRAQVNGALSYLVKGWISSQTQRVGGKHVDDRLIAPNDGHRHSRNCWSTLDNYVPAEVQIMLGPNVSRNVLSTSGGSWLPPTAISGPRIRRIGGRWEWEW